MNRKSGFTLIELLVVIAIIAILAAILFPVFTSAKQIAKRSACVSNMKQIGMSIKMYMDDNNDTLPLPLVPNGDDQDERYYWPVSTWRTAIDSYVKNDSVFNCPARGVAQYSLGGEYKRYRMGHYGINPNYINNPRERNIKQRALFIGEIVNVWHKGEWKFGDIACGNSGEFRYTSVIHDGYVSYLAMDGSAHSIKVVPKRGLDNSPLMNLH